jgi:hypothetical protein
VVVAAPLIVPLVSKIGWLLGSARNRNTVAGGASTTRDTTMNRHGEAIRPRTAGRDLDYCDARIL